MVEIEDSELVDKVGEVGRWGRLTESDIVAILAVRRLTIGLVYNKNKYVKVE